jgi:hypothetical protein
VNYNQTWIAERDSGKLNLHQRKEARQGAKFSTELSVNKHRKGREG